MEDLRRTKNTGGPLPESTILPVEARVLLMQAAQVQTDGINNRTAAVSRAVRKARKHWPEFFADDPIADGKKVPEQWVPERLRQSAQMDAAR